MSAPNEGSDSEHARGDPEIAGIIRLQILRDLEVRKRVGKLVLHLPALRRDVLHTSIFAVVITGDFG